MEEVSGMYTPQFLHTEKLKNNGFMGLKIFRGFRETYPWAYTTS